jgi:PAS domain S-box-containing protein
MSVILTTSAVVLMIMCTAYMIFEYASFRQALKNHVSVLGAVVAANSTAALAFDSQKDGYEILSALREEKQIEAACLYDNEGEIFAQYPTELSRDKFPAKPTKKGYWFEEGFLVGFQPVLQEGKQLGTLYVKSNMNEMYAQLQQYAFLALLLIAGSLVIAYILSKLLQKTISEPIIALEQTAQIISDQRDYSVRAIKYGNDELGALTDAFNQMLIRIESQNSEITTFNQRLEQKVKERTNELEDANIVLKQQKEFVETIINSSVDLVAVFDENLKYVLLNKQADYFYKIKRTDIVGKHILEVFPEVENTSMYKDLKRALEGETIHNIKYKSPILNRYFENYYIPLKDNNDEVYGVLTIGHDITNIMETNEKLEIVNSELLKSNRDLEQFAYVASHDLQEPLRKIQTFTQLLNENLHNEERKNKFLTKINQSALRMQQLIQDVLNFSRISNSMDAFVETDLNLILENLKTDFELLLREKEAVIIHPKLPVIKGIPLQLSQLFYNLISNSLKYSEQKPVINISVKAIAPEDVIKYQKLTGPGPYILIQFVDNGIGFEPQFSEKIFTIFQRLHDKHSYGGTGIGLALCKKIVENHNGMIWAESEKNHGSTFNVILPIDIKSN